MGHFMTDEAKIIDRHIAELHLQRALRSYRSSHAFVLVVVMPGDQGAGCWQGAASDLLKAMLKEDVEEGEYDWNRRDRNDMRADTFEITPRKVGDKVVETKSDPWTTVSFGNLRTVLICRRGDAEAVLGSRSSAIADAVIDINELDVKLVQRAIKNATDADVTLDEAGEILALPAEIRAVLRKTGRGIKSVLKRMGSSAPSEKAADDVPAKKSSEGPRLEGLHGYGAAKEWGLELARDLDDYAASLIGWEDVDSAILLSGPPGCGKTTFARALANTLDAHLVVGSYSAWLGTGEGHQGNLVKAMRGAFADARRNAPSVLLIDEIDNFVQRGSLGRPSSDEWMRGVVNALLECLDGAIGRPGVVVVGATNDASGIDSALLRPGRLDRHIQIGLPDAPSRAAILQYHLQASLDVSAIIDRTAGFSGADLERIARDARRLARRALVPVGVEHVVASMPQMHRMSREELLSTAIHELGHAVVGIALDHRCLKRIVVRKEVFVTNADQAAGFAHFDGLMTTRKDKAWWQNEICVYLGSVAVESLLLGGHCDGAAHDLQQATNAALHMLAVAGFGGSLMSEGLDGDLSVRRYRLERDIDEILQEQLQRASGIVGRYREVIARLAEKLADTGEISGDVVTLAVQEHGQPALVI